MIEKYTYRKLCLDVCYIGTISILTTQVLVDLRKTIRELCYWKVLVVQSKLYTKQCKIYQQSKKRNTIYVHLLPKSISELKLLDLVHVDLIGPYSKSIRQHHQGRTIIKNIFSLNCTTMINPATCWFEIIKIPTYNLDEVTGDIYYYIDKSYTMVR